MRLSFCATLLIVSNLALAQAVYIPPRQKKAEPTIVTMSIGDNIVPLIELGENGPTVVTFPGRIQDILMQHKAYEWKEVGVTKIKGGNGEEQLLSTVVFSRMESMTSDMKNFLSLPSNYITAVAIYQYNGKTYTHDIDMTWQPSSRRSSVTLVPVVDGLPNGAVIDALKQKYGVPKDEQSSFEKPEIRSASDRKGDTFKPKGINVDKFKAGGFGA
jgi:hypothetical protein